MALQPPRSAFHRRLQEIELLREDVTTGFNSLPDSSDAIANVATQLQLAVGKLNALALSGDRIGKAIESLAPKSDDNGFVGDFFCKALTPAGQINARVSVGHLFANAYFSNLADIYKATSFKPGKASALLKQLTGANTGATTPPLPTLAECAALLKALNNIFGDYAPGTSPIDGGDTGQTTTAA